MEFYLGFDGTYGSLVSAISTSYLRMLINSSNSLTWSLVTVLMSRFLIQLRSESKLNARPRAGRRRGSSISHDGTQTPNGDSDDGHDGDHEEEEEDEVEMEKRPSKSQTLTVTRTAQTRLKADDRIKAKVDGLTYTDGPKEAKASYGSVTEVEDKESLDGDVRRVSLRPVSSSLSGETVAVAPR